MKVYNVHVKYSQFCNSLHQRYFLFRKLCYLSLTGRISKLWILNMNRCVFSFFFWSLDVSKNRFHFRRRRGDRLRVGGRLRSGFPFRVDLRRQLIRQHVDHNAIHRPVPRHVGQTRRWLFTAGKVREAIKRRNSSRNNSTDNNLNDKQRWKNSGFILYQVFSDITDML